MKTLLFRGFGLVVALNLMLQFGPGALGGMIYSMFGQFEALADNIVYYDEAGNVQLNGVAADNLLNDLGEKSEKVTSFLGTKAQEVLNIAAEEAEVPEEATAEYEEMKTTATDWLDEINKIGGLFTN